MMAQMTERELVRVIEEGIESSDWSSGSEASANRENALNSYYGRKRSQTIAGRSSAVSTDVADMVEAVVAQVMPALDFDEVAVFDPTSPGDVDQARIESRICNVYLKDRNMGYTVLQEALRDALLLRNCIVKVWVEKRFHIQSQRYQNLDPIELEDVSAPTAPDQEVRLTRTELGDDESISVTVERTTTLRRLVIEAIDPVQFLLQEEFNSIFLDNAAFVGERHFWTRTDLLQMGYPKKKVMDLPAISDDTNSAATARNRGTSGARFESNADPAMEMIECFEVYPLVDFDGDGLAERRKVIMAGGSVGGSIMENVMFPHVPYASGTGFLQPHRWAGLSLYDKLIEVENIKTDTLRQYLDNLDANNNARLVIVDGVVNMDDATNSRPAGVIRADNVDAVKPLAIQDTGPSAQSLLNYMDKIRSERGGASLDLQSAELQLAGETAHGIERQYTSKEQLAQLITRTIGQTLIRSMFLRIHDALREFLPGEQPVLVGGDFVTVDPSTWMPRDQVRIVAGLSGGERAERKQALEGILAQQEKLAQAGYDGILVDLATYHDTLKDWTAAGGVETASRYWVDPRSEQAQAAQQGKQQAAEQQAAEQKQMQELLFVTQRQIESQQRQLDQWEHATQLRFDYWEATMKSGVEELRIAGQASAAGGQRDVDQAQQLGKIRAVT